MGFGSFHFPKVTHVFLDNNRIIRSSSNFDKTSLTGVDDVRQILLNTLTNNLENQFVGGVTQPNRSESF